MESRGTIREAGPVRVRSLYLGRTTNERAPEPFRHCSNRGPSPSTGAAQTGSRSGAIQIGDHGRAPQDSLRLMTQGHRRAIPLSFSLPLRNPYPIGGSGPFCRPLIVDRRRHCWAAFSVLRGCKLNIDVARKYQ
jgi:hypothetical protein